MSVGCRVVRGPDWTYGNQDGGEGHLGTVVEIGKPGSTNLPEKTAAVIWDSGGRGTYRAGQNGAYDLRIFDNATTGVNHPNIVCGSCGQPVIHGMRWHCTVCTDSHLCTVCYMADKHDLTHPFRRFDTASSEGEAVPKREGCTEIQAKGIFPGAKVVKGPDWEWEDQDCGIGNIGQVTSVGCWARGLTSVRSAVKVKWSSGSTYGYRVGHEGKVDLVYIEEESGGSYYKDHLPVLDHTAEVAPSSGIPREFKVGEKVKVELGKDRFQSMQEGHGAWNPRMASYIGKIGTVHDVSTQGDVIVRYEGLTRWWLHPETLTKVYRMNVTTLRSL
ncbi:E3 ubiquitin-protein ligase MIB2-like isoform X2 [Liolophura sinensis]|uniref:E3 ubiquitin-protein ligase MIB2-like isoform X2 n=1 Tax=Liolophura sinensis TaxID=3198878 RepID=UPI003158E3FF